MVFEVLADFAEFISTSLQNSRDVFIFYRAINENITNSSKCFSALLQKFSFSTQFSQCQQLGEYKSYTRMVEIDITFFGVRLTEKYTFVTSFSLFPFFPLLKLLSKLDSKFYLWPQLISIIVGVI